MQGAKYWEQRAEALEQKAYDTTTTFLKQVDASYKTNIVAIEKEISNFITKYATENGLTYAEASRNLTKVEFAEYKKTMASLWDEYKKTGSPEIKARIKEMEARQVVTRLDAIKNEIEMRVDILAEITSDDLEEHLNNLCLETYMQAGSDIAFGLDVGKAFTSANLAVIQSIVHYPYTGMMFSDRIWKCTDKLSVSIIETLQTGLVQGKSIPQMVRDLRAKMQNGDEKYSNYDLTRVVRTESQCILEQARAEANKAYGFKKYYIVTAKDERTCRKCGAQDGDEYFEDERIIGVTAPPFHPMCRCRTVSVPDYLEGLEE